MTAAIMPLDPDPNDASDAQNAQIGQFGADPAEPETPTRPRRATRKRAPRPTTPLTPVAEETPTETTTEPQTESAPVPSSSSSSSSSVTDPFTEAGGFDPDKTQLMPVTKLIEAMPYRARPLPPPPDPLEVTRDPLHRTLRDAVRSTVVQRWRTGPLPAAVRSSLANRSAFDPNDSGQTMPTPTPYAPDYRNTALTALPRMIALVYDAPKNGRAVSWWAWKRREAQLRFATWRMAWGGKRRLRQVARHWFVNEVGGERRVHTLGVAGGWQNGPLYQFARAQYGVTLNGDATRVVFATQVRTPYRAIGEGNRQRQEHANMRVRVWRAPRWVTDAHGELARSFTGRPIYVDQLLWWLDPDVQARLAATYAKHPPAWRVTRAALFQRTLVTLWAVAAILVRGLPHEAVRLLTWLRILRPKADPRS